MESEKKGLTLELDPALRQRLEAVAALKGVSMSRYCLAAIDRELANDEANGPSEQRPYRSDAERFAALQKKYFGDRVLPGSSVDLIREAREIRDAQMENWA